MLRLYSSLQILFGMLLVCLLGGLCIPMESFVDETSLLTKKIPDVLLEAAPLQYHETGPYIKRLNQRLRDWNVGSNPVATALPEADSFFDSHFPIVQERLLAQRENVRTLLYLLNDRGEGWERKVHAMFFPETEPGTPNVAILSTPQPWRSLDQKMQLLTFARVERLHRSELDRAMQSDYNASVLNSFLRLILPQTLDTLFDRLLPRYPHIEPPPIPPPSFEPPPIEQAPAQPSRFEGAPRERTARKTGFQ